MSKNNLRIITPLSKDLFVYSGSAYTGAQHFSKLFLEYFDKSSHTILGVALERPPTEPRSASFRTETRENGDPWLWASIRLGTEDILVIQDGEEIEPGAERIIEQISEQFKALNADVFFMNGLSALHYLFFLGAERAGLPIVTTHHGVWIMESLSHPSIAEDPEQIRLRTLIEKHTCTGSKRNIFLTDLSLKKFNEVVFPVPENQVEIVSLPYNPIFAERNPHPPVTSSQTKHIGLIGRWDPVKNHEAYLNLALEAKKQNLPWIFQAATMPIPQMKALEPIYDDYQLNIQTIDHVPPAELRDFYRSLDIVIVPSHFETFCGVIMEALLQEIPVLVSPNVGMSDYLRKHNLESWVASFESPAEVIEKMKKIMLEKVPHDLREDLLQNNTAESIFKQYEEIFADVHAGSLREKLSADKKTFISQA